MVVLVLVVLVVPAQADPAAVVVHVAVLQMKAIVPNGRDALSKNNALSQNNALSK